MVVVLWVMWSGAALGIAFRVLWINAPRWLYVPIYLVLGCAALGCCRSSSPRASR